MRYPYIYDCLRPCLDSFFPRHTYKQNEEERNVNWKKTTVGLLSLFLEDENDVTPTTAAMDYNVDVDDAMDC